MFCGQLPVPLHAWARGGGGGGQADVSSITRSSSVSGDMVKGIFVATAVAFDALSSRCIGSNIMWN
jgi:hypothetical protein